MKRVFKWLTVDGGDVKAQSYVNWFATTFEPRDFDGIERFMACFIHYCAKLNVLPRKEFLEAYIAVDGMQDVKKYNVRTDTMKSFDYKQASQLTEAFRIIADLAKITYAEYVSNNLEGHDFKVDMYSFMSDMKSASIQNALMKAYPRLSDGTNVSEVSDDLMVELSDINETYDTSKIKDVDFAPSGGSSTRVRQRHIADTGIPAIDGDIGGIYSRLIYTFNAQPKSGKSRFALCNFVYPVLEAGEDVVFYETELTQSQVENILIAYHIVRVYKGRFKIPDSIMNKWDQMTDEQRQLYESARIDLFESGRYGKFYFRKPFVVEKAKDEVLAIQRTSENIGLVVVDYMGLSKSEPLSKWEREKEEYKIISDAYKTIGDLRELIDCAFLCVNQFNDKGIDSAYAGKEIRPGMIQGGHIVQRHTDYDINMTYTEEQKLARVRTLSAGMVRGAAGFDGVLLSLDLSVSIFRQEIQR